MRVLISGAGIAGLSLARCLKNYNIDCTLIEKKASLTAFGTGIALPFNAIRALHQLGLSEKVLYVAHQVHEILYYQSKGKLLSKARLDIPPLDQDVFIALERSQLHEILAHDINITFDTVIESFQELSDGVYVCCSASAMSGKYDLVISAEGIHSALRQKLYPERNTLVDYGLTNWRFMIDWPDHGIEPSYYFGRDDLFMAYPISNDRLYCYAHLYDPEKKYYLQKPLDVLQQHFRQCEDKVKKSIALIENDSDIVVGRSGLPH